MLPPALIAIRTRHALLLAATAYAAEVPIARAEPKVPTALARLDVNSNSGCPTRAALIERVRARSPRVRFVDDGALAIRAQFSTTRSGAVTSDITLASSGARASVRHVLAHTCAEAADAVALIIAVTLDPTSADQGHDVSSAEGAPLGSHADGSPDSADKDANRAPPAPTSVEKAGPGPPSAAAGSATSQPSKAASSPSRHEFRAELAAQSFLGPAPGIMPGVALYATAGLDRPALWSPAVTLGATHAWRTSIEAQGGTASFELDAASFDACPLRFRLGAVHARPCASVLIGRLSARGTNTRNPAGESARPFWVVGGAAVVSADLPWLLEASARVAVGANLVRDSFEFTPRIFHAVPALTGAASVGLGLHWP